MQYERPAAKLHCSQEDNRQNEIYDDWTLRWCAGDCSRGPIEEYWKGFRNLFVGIVAEDGVGLYIIILVEGADGCFWTNG